MKNKIGILDYGCGNLNSIINAFNAIDVESAVVTEADELRYYSKLVFPGVGAFRSAMEKLQEKNLVEALNEYIKIGSYLLGICLGMQLMCLSSEEHGKSLGLGWINADVLMLSDSIDLKVPHMGWNGLRFKKDIPCVQGIDPRSDMYFVHSYYVKNYDSEDVVATTNYGINFTSIFSKDNLMGIQFHPEKSQKSGLQILKNFSMVDQKC